MPGLEQSKPFRKMGLHSSPTGELFLTDVRVGKDRLLGETEGSPGGSEGRESAKGNFVTERAGVAAMSLGLIEECLKLSVQYAKDRLLWERPISEFQLIQLKLARMEIARLNVENLVFRHIEMTCGRQEPDPGRGLGHEALLGPGRLGGGHGGGAALRRQRLHVRVPGGAAGARRQGVPDLRRHRRDPGDAHRPRPPRAAERSAPMADVRRRGRRSTPSTTRWSTCAARSTAGPSWPSPSTHTTALIRDHMAALGIDEAAGSPRPAGIFAMDGGRPGRTRRAAGRHRRAAGAGGRGAAPCHSEVEGVMHACGHDVHVAALLGAAARAGRRGARTCPGATSSSSSRPRRRCAAPRR